MSQPSSLTGFGNAGPWLRCRHERDGANCGVTNAQQLDRLPGHLKLHARLTRRRVTTSLILLKLQEKKERKTIRTNNQGHLFQTARPHQPATPKPRDPRSKPEEQGPGLEVSCCNQSLKGNDIAAPQRPGVGACPFNTVFSHHDMQLCVGLAAEGPQNES